MRSKWYLKLLPAALVGLPVLALAQTNAQGAYPETMKNVLLIAVTTLLLFVILRLHSIYLASLRLQELELRREKGTDQAPPARPENTSYKPDLRWLTYVGMGLVALLILYTGYITFTSGPGGKAADTDEEVTVAAAAGKPSYLVDETNVTLLDDEPSLAAGKKTYETLCIQCHGKNGEGLIGPNFTDNYWIHGPDIKELFKVIKYGVPEKGMISWTAQLSPSQMQQVASYILTFQGTDPPNQKEPEGRPYGTDGQPVDEAEPADASFIDEKAKNYEEVPANGNIAQGKLLFNAVLGCAHCHGTNAYGHVDNRDLKSMEKRYGEKAGLVFDIVTREGRPGTAMPPWTHLSSKQLTDLKTFVFSLQEK